MTFASAARNSPTRVTSSGSKEAPSAVPHYRIPAPELSSGCTRGITRKRTGRHCAGVGIKWEEPRTPLIKRHFNEVWRESRGHTFGPSLIRTEGISSRLILFVFHQSGALRREIFSSTESCSTSSGMWASRNGWAIVKQRAGKTTNRRGRVKQRGGHGDG